MDFRLLWVIVKRDVKNSLAVSRSGRKGLILTAFLWALSIAMVMGIFYGARKLFTFTEVQLQAFPGLRNVLDFNLLNVVAIFAFVMIFVTEMQMIYRMLYESGDLPFLLSQPIPIGTVFASKFLGAYVQVLLTNLMFTGPVWLAYGVARQAPLFYYPVALAGVALATLLACSTVSLMMVAVMGYIPGRRMKQLTITAGAVFGLIVVLISQIATRKMAEANVLESLQQLGSMSLTQLWYLPSTWLVNMSLGLVPGFGVQALPGALALAFTSLSFTWLTVAVAGKQFLRGWSGASEEGTRIKRASVRTGVRTGVGPSARSARAPLGASLQGVSWALLKKDLTLMFRDPMTWYNLLVGVVVLVFFVLNVKGDAPDTAERLAIQRGLMLVMPAFMAAVSVGQMGGVSLSLEASRFWLLACQPCSGKEVFRAKMAYAFAPGAVLAVAYVIGVKLVGDVSMYPIWLCILVVLAMVLAVSAFQVLLDSLFPDFTLRIGFGETKTSGKNAGKLLMNMFGSMGLVAGMAFVLLLPGFRWATERFGSSALWVSFGILLLMAAGIFALAQRVAASRVDRYLTNWTSGSGS
ncbi:MAG TPA: hypothetical protein GX510_04710 [Firmicutes bacterium]|nr:hypothetical protein [Candidatus Fermentithermobacillaceae bacterium]